MGTESTKTKGTGASKEGLLAVGRIGKLFGTGGGVTLSLYDTFPGEINNEEPLWVIVDSLAVPLFLESFERRGRSGALVVFSDIDTPERAGEFIGKELFIKQAAGEGNIEKDDDELYLEGLVGFAAIIGEEGSKKKLDGEVTAFLDSELNPLFEVMADGSGILIPASEEFIVAIDPDERLVEFALPAGLLELYI